MSETYTRAVAAIRSHAESTQARLDAAAAEARAAAVARWRAMATEGVEESSPSYPVCALVAQTIHVGRDDGYPAVEIPVEVRSVIVAARLAGVLPREPDRSIVTGSIVWHSDGSGVYRTRGQSPHDADYAAYSAASDYRSGQKWQSL